VKGALLSAAPGLTLVDVTHAVPPGDVRAGAYLLARAWPRFPSGTVHLAVVDPGVGTGRAALAVAAHGHYFVGPDNGLFTLVLRDAEVQIVVLPTPDGASPTFHGRDVFAPAAAHLAAGVPLDALGPTIPVEELHVVELPSPMVAAGAVGARVTGIDGFGNVQLNVRPHDLEAAGIGPILTVRGRVVSRVGIFADLPEGTLGAIIDSQGQLALVVNRGSAAETLGLSTGKTVVLE